ncbi:MAG: carboxypeptidase regulatory-like domain-containing protein [Thermococcus sp.]|uniref:COG1470 family protein n=1 Tax=Thermococcus sp. TaxID=35749 RepID=UPI001DDE0F72|nr:NEW3 domain-containing protein [Thermococcus sp.]MBO8174544.1 carboxypeptidase regulatory-like domain-containing protein [Thermococcus sp.]
MKKFVLSMLTVSLLLLSLVPPITAQPWVEVFQGKIKVGESLQVGDYQIKLTLSKDYLPYIIIYQGNDIKALQMVKFGGIIEVDNLRIIPGSFDGEQLFLIIQYQPQLSQEIIPKVGQSYTVDGYTFEVLNMTNENITIKLGSMEYVIKNGSYDVYDKLALEYLDGKLLVYVADITVEKTPELEYEIHYTFDAITAKAGDSVDIPIEVINKGNDDITLPLKIISKPLNWDVKLADAQKGYEVSEITLKAGEVRYLNLAVTLPEDASGTGIIKFSIGKELGEVKIYVQQREEIDVKLSILSIESEAGEKVAFPIMLTNYGSDKVVNVQVVEKPKDWDAYFILNGVRIRSFLLPSATPQELSLIVEIPRNAELGTHTIRVAINNNSYSFSVFVYKTYKGEKATLSLSVVDDEGNPVPKAKVCINETTTYFTDTAGQLKTELDPGKYIITIEKKGYSNASKEIELLDGEEKSITMALQRAPYYFNVEMDTDTLSVSFEYQLPYEIRIVNLGKNDDEYKLSLVGLPNEWAYRFLRDPQSNVEVSSISINSGQSKSVWLKIIPSYNAQPGTYHAKLIVESSSGIKFEKELEIELIGNYELDVNLMNYQLSVQAGKEVSTRIILSNPGTAPITNINFDIKAPDGWEVTVSPERIAKLDRGGYQEVTLTIKVPDTTPAGEYRVTITVKSDQTEWEDSIRVRVRQSSSSAYLGILILILTFGAVIFMMRRIGRR